MNLDLPTRLESIQEKIDSKDTGLRGSVFLHVDFIRVGNRRMIHDIRLSEKGKDGSGLDKLFTLLGDRLTDIARREINGGGK
jgi:hypothetical protein